MHIVYRIYRSLGLELCEKSFAIDNSQIHPFQATVYLKTDNHPELVITVNITCMMVLTSVYLSVSSSLPSTPSIKPVEIWLLGNLAYPFFIIIASILQHVSIHQSIDFIMNC